MPSFTRLKIDPSKLTLDLSGGNYTLRVNSGFLNDPYSGLDSQQQNLSFSVDGTPPALVDVTPDVGTTNISQAAVVLQYDKIIDIRSGNFYLYRVDTPDVLVQTIAHTDSRISTNGVFVYINLTGLLSNSETYYITSDTGVITDAVGVDAAALTSSDVSFTTSSSVGTIDITGSATLTYADTLVNHSVTRDFTANDRSDIFATDQLTTTETNYQIVATLTSGEFWKQDPGNIPQGSATNTVTVTSLSVLNQYGYYSVVDTTSDDTMTLKFYVDVGGTYKLVDSTSVTLNYAGTNPNAYEVVSITQTDTAYRFDYMFEKYGSSTTVDLLVVGGGGGAIPYHQYTDPVYSRSHTTSAGGGGGQVLSATGITIDFTADHSVTIGAGGSAGVEYAGSPSSDSASDGGDTTGFGYTAKGGGGATWINDYRAEGGNSWTATPTWGTTNTLIEGGIDDQPLADSAPRFVALAGAGFMGSPGIQDPPGATGGYWYNGADPATVGAYGNFGYGSGYNDGSFEATSTGAKEVVAIGFETWNGDSGILGKGGFGDGLSISANWNSWIDNGITRLVFPDSTEVGVNNGWGGSSVISGTGHTSAGASQTAQNGNPGVIKLKITL